MWVEHIGVIMAGVFIALILAHLGLHFWFKLRKRRRQSTATIEEKD